MTKDLTRGSPMRLILSFGVPILFGYLFQQLYNVVDTAIVGKALGGAALAAVGSTGSINFLVVGFCVGICGGFSIPVAQQFGAGNHQQLRRYVTGGAWLCILFGIVMTVVTVLLCRPILTAMNTPADIYERAYWYIVTIFAGLPAYFLYNFAAGILRALGDSRTPVVWLIVASLVNIVLDIVFILSFHMDVFGAAFATVLAQGLAGIGCLVRMCRGFPVLKMEREDWRWDWARTGRLCLMGLPMGLQYSITAIGSVMIQAAVNSLGTAYVTAVTAASKVSMFFCCPFDALGGTMATYAGQNAGAGKTDRIRQGVRSATFIGSIYSVLACIVLTLFGGVIPLLFVDASETVVIHQAHQFLTFNSLFYIPLTIVNVWRFTIQGMGYSLLAILAGVCEMIARALVGFALVPIFGYIIICFASPLAWLMADAFLIPAFYYCLRNLLKAQEMLE